MDWQIYTREQKDYEILQDEYSVLNKIYQQVIDHLKSCNKDKVLVGDICALWSAVSKREKFISRLMSFLNSQENIISGYKELASTLGSDQDIEVKEILKQKYDFTLKSVDAAQLREQVAQEKIESLHYHIRRLNDELMLRTCFESEEEEAKSAKEFQEKQIKEIEKLSNELDEKTSKIKCLIAQSEETEKKYTEATLKMSQLSSDLENMKIQLLFEVTLREKIEEEKTEIKNSEERLRKDNEALKCTINELECKIKSFEKSEKILQIEKQLLQGHYEKVNELKKQTQEEFSAQAVEFENICEALNVIENMIKNDEENLLKSKQESASLIKMFESGATNLNKMSSEIVGNEKEKDAHNLKGSYYDKDILQRKKVKTEQYSAQDSSKLKKNHIGSKIKTINRKKKKQIKLEDSSIDDLNKEISRSSNKTKQNKTKQNGFDQKTPDINKKIAVYEQLIKVQKIDLDMYEKMATKFKHVIGDLERERQRNIANLKDLFMKLDSARKEIKLKDADNKLIRREMDHLNLIIKHKTIKCDDMETQRNEKNRAAVQAQDEASEVKDKMSDLNCYIRKLKGDIEKRDNQIRRDGMAIRKLKQSNRGLKVKIELSAEKNKSLNTEINSLNTELMNYKDSFAKVNATQKKTAMELNEMTKERSVIGSQLVRRNDEIVLVRSRLVILQGIQDKQKVDISKRQNEIKLLKTEIDHMRIEKIKFEKERKNMTDFRKEIYCLEKNLAKERLRNQTLEALTTTPTNIHRWRRLEGNDPQKMMLIKKNQLANKKILQLDSIIHAKNQEISDWKDKLYETRAAMSYLCTKEEMRKVWIVQQDMKLWNNQLQQSKAAEKTLATAISLNKIEVEHLKEEVKKNKKQFFEQKKMAEKYKEKYETLKKEMDNEESEKIKKVSEEKHPLYQNITKKYKKHNQIPQICVTQIKTTSRINLNKTFSNYNLHK